MEHGDFARRFLAEQEIGRDASDQTLSVYHDNGTDVGVWRQDRRTTCGQG